MARRKGTNTKQALVTDALVRHDWIPEEAYLDLSGQKPGTINRVGFKPLVYMTYPVKGMPGIARNIGEPFNPYGANVYSIPYEELTQHQMCLRQCYAIKSHTRGGKRPNPYGYSRPDNPAPTPTPEPTPAPDNPMPDVPDTPEPDVPDTPEPDDTPDDTPVIPAEPASAFERGYRELWRLRNFAASRNLTNKLDSMRAMIDMVNLLKQDVPLDTVLAAITADWSPDTIFQARQYHDCTPKNYDADRRRPFEYGEPPSEFHHAIFPHLLNALKAGVHTYLHGPAGTSKSSAARQCADVLKILYYEINLANETVGAVKGKHTINGFIESEVIPAYSKGGVLCLEEFDAAMPNVATALNNMLASDSWHNDSNGKTYKRHKNFRVVATGNTLGNGSDVQFTGRNRLDGATLDRFRVGRIYTGLDIRLERAIFESMIAEVK